MGKNIAGGLSEDQWVPVWLELHGESHLDNARNAVGIDQKGYWWIETRSLWQSGTGDPKKFFDDYSINGPKPLV